MNTVASLIYRALVWKERQRAKAAREATHRVSTASDHLTTGRRGETLAYWYLRQSGYTIVARNRRRFGSAGELDLIGWDGPVLAFVEVKTRSSESNGPPAAAVLPRQRQRIVNAARQYVKRLKRKEVTYRFDIASVSWDDTAGFQVQLIKDAFKET